MGSLRLEYSQVRKGGFTPDCLAMGVGGGKPPFLSREFKQRMVSSEVSPSSY